MPHAAATARQPQPYVWAAGSARCPEYWFPRQCPWSTGTGSSVPPTGSTPSSTAGWMRSGGAKLFACRLPAAGFRPFGKPVPHAQGRAARSCRTGR
ncbi:DUF6886 family protein [Amycolatopsis rubida]|uniref:DUF6886 family protein n=1 Tax=Amycolatopsis rubida TaxID=112413 RepID=UPI003CC79CA1